MPKRRHEEAANESSKLTMIIMAIGGLAVAGLVVWALTRTVQPAPATTASTEVPMGVEQTTATMANPTLPPLDTANMPPASATTPTTTAAVSTSGYVPNPPTNDENASVPRISLGDLKAKIDAKEVTVIDVRQDVAFNTAHIPGSMHIPMAVVETQIANIPKDKPIVTYCT